MYEFLQETVANNMTGKVRSVTPETTVGDLYRLFAADDFDAYPVVKDDTLVGMVSSWMRSRSLLSPRIRCYRILPMGWASPSMRS